MSTSSEGKKGPAEDVKKLFLRAFGNSAAAAGPKWALIVDDEASIRRMIARSLTSVDSSLVVHEAENGQEALDVLQMIRKSSGTDPILIVTDLQMPVMDGWDFIDALWKQCEEKGLVSGIPVIVLSASTGEKGIFRKSSVHGEKNSYTPLVTIAKEDCVKPLKYDSQGEKGLATWLEYFLR